MARITDQGLVELKKRALASVRTNAHIAGASDFILDLIEEVQELRKAPPMAVGVGKLTVGDMDVQKAPVPEPVAPEPEVVPEPEAPKEQEPEAPVEEAPAPEARRKRK
jgi:hypothetical protein